MKYEQFFNNDPIELQVLDNRVKIHDSYNSYSGSFDLQYLVDMVGQFKEWGKRTTEINTVNFHSYGYRGNWIVPSRIKYMIEMLNGALIFKKKNKSQLKRMAISSIQKDLAILKVLLESRT